MAFFTRPLPAVWHTACALLFGTLSACAQVPEAAAPAAPADAAQTAQSSTRLDAPLLYELLLGEMSAVQGDAQDAVALLLDAARATQDAQLYRRATDIALQARSGPQALMAAQAWQQAFPRSREANRYVLQILLLLNRVSDTIEPLAQTLSITPTDQKSAAYVSIAQLYRHVSDKKLAAAVVEQAVQADLHNADTAPSAWALVGHMRLLAGQKTLALDAVEKSHAYSPGNSAAALLALELVEAGMPSAEEVLRSYLSQTPAQSIRLAWAQVLLDRQRLSEAQTQIDAVLAHDPAQAQAWLAQAVLDAQRGQWAQVQQTLGSFTPLIAAMTTPQERDAAWAQAGLLGARSALMQGDNALAQQWLERIPAHIDDIRVRALRAALLARQGDLTQALELLQNSPHTSQDQKIQAQVHLLRDNGAYGQAYVLQTQLAARHPDDADMAYETALLAEKIGQLDTMEALLRQLIERHPDYYHAHNALGYSLAERGIELEEARRLIETALSYAPDDPFITDSLGWLAYRQGDLAQAATLLERAYGLRDDVEIATHLAEVLWMQGEHTRARSLWRTAQQRDPDNPVLRETLERLRVQQP